MPETENEPIEERDLIAAPEVQLHDMGGGCRCRPRREDVSLEDGTRPGIVWIHSSLDGPCPPEEVADAEPVRGHPPVNEVRGG